MYKTEHILDELSEIQWRKISHNHYIQYLAAGFRSIEAHTQNEK